jgi:hypothetical protein
MWREKFIISILTTLILFSIIIPSIHAEEDSMAIFMFIEDKPAYVDGEPVNITIHVLDKGEYLDNPDNVTLTVNETKEINLTKIETGIYEATYELNISDAESPTWPAMTFEAFASYGKNSESIINSIMVHAEEQDTTELRVEIKVDDPKDLYPRPGDEVELTVTVKINGELGNPDTLKIDYDGTIIPHAFESTGIYKAIYTISPYLKRSETFYIVAHANKNDIREYSSVILKTAFLNIWLHNASLKNNIYEVYMYVADLEGKPVADAYIDIWAFSFFDQHVAEGRTDENGMAYISFTNNLYPFWFSYDVIVISPQNVKQEFRWYIPEFSPSGGQNPRNDKFDVFSDTGNQYVSFGANEKRVYTAYYDKSLWKNSEICYYVVFYNGYIYPDGGIEKKKDGFIVNHGCVNTDENGKFEIEFTAPYIEGEINIHFEAGVKRSSSKNDNLSYLRAYTSFCQIRKMVDTEIKEEGINIEMEDLILGKNMTVSSSLAGSEGFIGEITWSLEDESWDQESGKTSEYMAESNGIFTGVINLPEFLPLDIDYTIKVSITDTDTKTTYYNYIKVQPIGKASDMDGDGLPDSWEQEYFQNLDFDLNDDPDNDGLTNEEEFEYKTNPNNKDTDSDGMHDGWELENELDPFYDDSQFDDDYDGFSNLREFKADTDPNDEASFPIQEKGNNIISQFWGVILIGIFAGAFVITIFILKRSRKSEPQNVLEVTEVEEYQEKPPPPEMIN